MVTQLYFYKVCLLQADNFDIINVFDAVKKLP